MHDFTLKPSKSDELNWTYNSEVAEQVKSSPSPLPMIITYTRHCHWVQLWSLCCLTVMTQGCGSRPVHEHRTLYSFIHVVFWLTISCRARWHATPVSDFDNCFKWLCQLIYACCCVDVMIPRRDIARPSSVLPARDYACSWVAPVCLSLHEWFDRYRIQHSRWTYAKRLDAFLGFSAAQA